MKKRLTFLLLIAALTAGGILLFQGYWVYNTYQTGESNLNKLLQDALQKSIENYQVGRSELPATLKSGAPYIAMLESIPADTGTHLKVHQGDQNDQRYMAKVQAIPLKLSSLDRVKVMLAETQFMSAALMNSMDLKELTRVFKAELHRRNIDLPFVLVLLKNQQTIPPGKIAAFINFSNNSPMVEALIGHTNELVLKQNIIPAMISLILILFSAGSLCYMWIIIRRQMQLDHIKNDFISNMTHELRTPISILKSTHEALYRYGDIHEPEKAERYLKINTEILVKLEHNVDRILDIARYESGDKPVSPETVDLPELLRVVIERFRSDDGPTIDLFRLSAIRNVVTDSHIIDTILSNLLDNALKYGDDKMKVTIRLTSSEVGWELEVTDNGPGIEPQYLPFIFDKFYRVPSGNLHEVKGYGIGLSYVKQLVSNLNGVISVKSKLKTGTTFTIHFPFL
ncbi:sensor histidine kinase KdpD [Pedobacter sp. L105]|uniref:sensor histidine kinase n=1 Tax=Pedobacter sp. L105 TaxID=1641871 RepID=UPI00131CC694|nr:HAMP domain-containing sensor histidine kinase [Pedobacter sp. L105]